MANALTKLLSGSSGQDDFDPYEDLETEDKKSTNSQTLEGPVDDSDPYTNPPGVDTDPSDVGEDVDPVLARIEKLEQRVKEKDEHIGRLESDTREYRQLLNELVTREVPEVEEVDPLDDPYMQNLINEALESENPAAAFKEVGRYLKESALEEVKRELEPMRQNARAAEAARKAQMQMASELETALEQIPGAEPIIAEAANSGFQSGELVKRIQNNPNAVLVPGGVYGIVAQIVAERGGFSRSDPTPNKPNPQTAPSGGRSPRPSSKRPPTSKKSGEDELSVEERAARSIVNARTGASDLPFFK